VVIKEVEEQLILGLGGISPIQRILVYADGVVLFLKDEEVAVKETLLIFGEASGLKVNYIKNTARPWVIRGDEDTTRKKNIGRFTTSDAI
jgi:hypothetical protein